jgi:hypothetical protein
LSLEFSDNLKQCEIIPQLTLPRMPQWNDMSERRNRTLLDMVRSMMSETEKGKPIVPPLPPPKGLDLALKHMVCK